MCCSMTQGDVGHLVDAHDPQQAGDHGVHVAKAHEFTLSLKVARILKSVPAQTKSIRRRRRQSTWTSRRSAAKAAKRFRVSFAAPQSSRSNTNDVRSACCASHGSLRDFPRRDDAPLPGRWRLLEGHRVIDCDVLEARLVASVLQQFEQHQPGVACLRLPVRTDCDRTSASAWTLTSITLSLSAASPATQSAIRRIPSHPPPRTLATSMRTRRYRARSWRAGRTVALRAESWPFRFTNGSSVPAALLAAPDRSCHGGGERSKQVA